MTIKKTEVHGLVLGDFTAIKATTGDQVIDFSVYAQEGSKVARVFGRQLKQLTN